MKAQAQNIATRTPTTRTCFILGSNSDLGNATVKGCTTVEAVSVAPSSRCKFPSSFNIEPDFTDSSMRPAGGLVELTEQATEKEVKSTTGDRKKRRDRNIVEPTTKNGYSNLGAASKTLAKSKNQ